MNLLVGTIQNEDGDWYAWHGDTKTGPYSSFREIVDYVVNNTTKDLAGNEITIIHPDENMADIVVIPEMVCYNRD